MSLQLAIAQESHFEEDVSYGLGYASSLAMESINELARSYNGIGLEADDSDAKGGSLLSRIGGQIKRFFVWVKDLVMKVVDYVTNREKKEARAAEEINAFAAKHPQLLSADIATKEVNIPKEGSTAEVAKENAAAVVSKVAEELRQEVNANVQDDTERQAILRAFESRGGDDYIAEARQNERDAQTAAAKAADDKAKADQAAEAAAASRKASDRARLAGATKLIVDFLRSKSAFASALGVAARDRVLIGALVTGKGTEVSKIKVALDFLIDDVVDPTVRLLSRIDLKGRPDQASTAIDGYFKVIERDARVIFGDNGIREGVEQVLANARKNTKFDTLPTGALSGAGEVITTSLDMRSKISAAMKELQQGLDKANVESIGDDLESIQAKIKDSPEIKELVPRLGQFQKSVVGALHAMRMLLKEVQLNPEFFAAAAHFRDVSIKIGAEAIWLKEFAAQSNDTYASSLAKRMELTLTGKA